MNSVSTIQRRHQMIMPLRISKNKRRLGLIARVQCSIGSREALSNSWSSQQKDAISCYVSYDSVSFSWRHPRGPGSGGSDQITDSRMILKIQVKVLKN